MKKWMVAAGCAATAAIAIWATLFRASDEEEIKKTLDRLVDATMVKDGENVISRTARIGHAIDDTTSEDVHVDVPDLGIRTAGRKPLVEKAVQAGLLFTSSECELVGTKVEVDEHATLAKVDTTAVFTGIRGGDRRADRRDVHLLLHKDGGWRVSSVDVRAPD